MENCNCKQVVQTVEHPNVEAAIEKALRLYDADKIGVADYALESAGEFFSLRSLESISFD